MDWEVLEVLIEVELEVELVLIEVEELVEVVVLPPWPSLRTVE